MVPGQERVGAVLNDTYRLERLIGQGGMGSVYAAAHLRLPKGVAVKLLDVHAFSSPQVFDRFRREAEIASSLGEEHIAEVSDFNHAEDGAPYMVMELLAGEDLAARLRRLRKLSLKQTARMVDHVAIALRAAHGRDIVHRDLKPENIFMCSRDGRDDFVKVLDFGISKIRTSAGGGTQSGALLGTPNFMAPEQAMGKRDVDHRVDIFALGALSYECLTGKMAFDGRTLATIIDQICNGTPVPMRSIDAQIPEAVERVVARAMAKRPEDRYQDVVSMRDEFLDACGFRTLADPLVTAARVLPEPVAAVVAAAASREGPHDTLIDLPRDTIADAPPLAREEPSPRTVDLMSQLLWRPRRRRLALLAVALGIAGGAAIGLMTRRTPALPGAAPTKVATASTTAVGPAAPAAPAAVPPPAVAPAAPAAPVAPGVAAPENAAAPAPAAPPGTPPVPAVSAPVIAPPSPLAPPGPVRVVRIRLRSRPKGASVYRKDSNELLGKTPFVLKLPAGKERVPFVVKKRGYRDRQLGITPDKNKVSRVSLKRTRR